MAGRIATTSSASFGIAAFQRVERLAEQLLGEAAHLRDLLVEQRQLFLV